MGFEMIMVIVMEHHIGEPAETAAETASAAAAGTGPSSTASQIRTLADMHYFATSDSQRLQIVATFEDLESPFAVAYHTG